MPILNASFKISEFFLHVINIKKCNFFMLKCPEISLNCPRKKGENA